LSGRAGKLKAERERGRGGEEKKKMRSSRGKAPLRMTAFLVSSY